MRRRRAGVALVERRRAVHAHGLARVALTALKRPGIVVRGHVPRAAHLVVDVLAERGRVGPVLARAEAELRVRHVVRPLVHLHILARERVREHEPADRVAVPVCAVWIELAASVARRDVDLRQVADAGDLDVVGSLHEMRALDRVRWDGTCAIAVLETPRDFNTLGVADSRICTWLRRSIEAKVIDRVDVDVLAHGVLVIAGTTLVGPGLTLFGLVW